MEKLYRRASQYSQVSVRLRRICHYFDDLLVVQRWRCGAMMLKCVKKIYFNACTSSFHFISHTIWSMMRRDTDQNREHIPQINVHVCILYRRRRTLVNLSVSFIFISEFVKRCLLLHHPEFVPGGGTYLTWLSCRARKSSFIWFYCIAIKCNFIPCNIFSRRQYCVSYFLWLRFHGQLFQGNDVDY